MAVVRQRLGRGAYDFAHKRCNCYLLESRNKLGKGAIRSSSLSAGFLLGDKQNGDDAADSVTVGVSQDSYTRVTPLFGTVDDVWENRNVAEYYYYHGLNKEDLLSNKTNQNIEKSPPLYRSNAKFRGTFCTSRSAPQQSPGSRSLFGGQVVFIRAFRDNGARSEPLYKTKTGYYDILEVASTATVAQIKTAYYRQSFINHPDRNAGSDEATVRFSEISEAYTVLGNKALRKKYDRGLLSQSDLVATARPSAKDAAGSSGKPQTGARRSMVGADNRGGDFDAFFKAYYKEQLQRQQNLRLRKEEMRKRKEETMGERKVGNMVEMGLAVVLALAVGLMLSLKQR